MLIRFNDSGSYEQPLEPVEVSGQRYVLPSDFVDGLSFLRRFVTKGAVFPIHHGSVWVTDWNFVESRVHIVDGTLYLLTNNLIVSYEIGECDMPNFSFDVRAIRTIEAFGAPPSNVVIDRCAVFQWENGQEVRMEASRAYDSLGGSGLTDRVVGALDKYWRNFSNGVTLTDEERTDIRKRAHGTQAVFLRPEGMLACSSRDGEDWTYIAGRKFATGLKGSKRVHSKAFSAMMQIADEIAFDTNPICFRHAHGRGILVENTLGSNVPNFDVEPV